MEDDSEPRNREKQEKRVELDRSAQGIARRRKRIWFDLAMIGAAVGAIAFAASRFDVFKLLTDWLRAHEPTPIDEILTILIALFFFGGIFAYRRWLDLRLEIRARERTERALRLLGAELETRVEARTSDLRADIAKRTQVESALRASESRIRALMDNAKDAIFVNSPEGAIIDCNLAAESLLGRPRSEILSLRVADSVAPEERERVGKAIAETLAGGGVDGFETFSLRVDGTRVPVEVSASVVEVGRETLILAIVRDVSERKRLEEQYRHAQKTEAIARLAGGVAHDFNNLLMIVQGIADVLPLHAGDEKAMTKDLESLRMIAERGGALTRQLLAFSRQQVLQTEIVDVRKRVNDLTPTIDPGEETILVVEDEAIIRQMTESFLSEIGYRVISAADGWKAQEMLADEKGRIHLVVTDIILPGPGGQEIATAAVARDPNTRVIFMSGYTDDAEIQRSVGIEGFDFLQKPFPLHLLASRIRAALDRVA